MIVAVFKATRGHYNRVAAQLTLKGYEPALLRHNTVIPIGGSSAPSSRRCDTP